MARIVDKDTRLIDVDFGPVNVGVGRDAGSFVPTSAFALGNGIKQIIAPAKNALPSATVNGSFVQYARIDLEYMTMNNEVMQPVEVSIQRTSPVPLGFHLNGNNFEQMEEYIYVFSRPLNNQDIETSFNLELLRELGLDRSSGGYGGQSAGIPTHEQTIYAEKRMYSYSNALGATINNGELVEPPANTLYASMYGMPVLDSVTTWGTLSAITGPSLHAYRVIIMRNQVFAPPENGLYTNVDGPYVGSTQCKWPPVNITFLCKDPNYTEGEYLTRLANAMNSIPERGPTA
tara:strand:+ start:661 stop:1527 length:867 start_codon:yes stop_codon:yes gene_type:complete